VVEPAGRRFMERILSSAAHGINVIYAMISAMFSSAPLSVLCYLQRIKP
jgi:hypothetical protein